MAKCSLVIEQEKLSSANEMKQLKMKHKHGLDKINLLLAQVDACAIWGDSIVKKKNLPLFILYLITGRIYSQRNTTRIFYILLFLSLSLFINFINAQDRPEKRLEAHLEYQFLNYNYVTAGIGYIAMHRFRGKYTGDYVFRMISMNYSRAFINEDWGAFIRFLKYSSTVNLAFVSAFEVNYKSVSKKDHYALKPLIGLNYSFVRLMYGYNFDFYTTKAERISQHELILGFHIAFLKPKSRV